MFHQTKHVITPSGNPKNKKHLQRTENRVRLFSSLDCLFELSWKSCDELAMDLLRMILQHCGMIDGQNIISDMRITATRETILSRCCKLYNEKLSLISSGLLLSMNTENNEWILYHSIIDNFDRYYKRKFHGHNRQSEMLHFITRLVKGIPCKLKITTLCDGYRSCINPIKLSTIEEYLEDLSLHLKKSFDQNYSNYQQI